MNSQKGNVTIIGLIFSLFVSYVTLNVVASSLKEFKKRSGLRTLSLCTKKYILSTQKIVKDINKINQILNSTQLLEKISQVVPPLSVPTKLGVAQARKLLIMYQDSLYVSYLKKVSQKTKEGCPFPLKTVLYPYEHQLSLIRDTNGLARMREKKWTIKIENQNYGLPLTFSIESNLDTELITKVNLYSKEFLGFLY